MNYLENVRYTGSLAHTTTEAKLEVLQKNWVIDDDPVRGAKDMMIFARIRELLLN
jgi:hypothetical protein